MAIEKRSNDTWRFTINHKGQRYRMNFNGTEREAKRAHDAFKVDVTRGNVGNNENMKFYELANTVYNEYCKKHIKASTQRIYQTNYNIHLLPYFGDKKLSAITPIMIQKFMNEKAAKYKFNTVSSISSTLSSTFQFAVDWKIIKESPYQNIKLPKRDQKSSELMSLDNIRQLLEIYRNDSNLMHKSAFYLAIGCGMRNSEIRALTLDDIDFSNNLININKQLGQDRDSEGNILDDVVITTKTNGSTRKVYAPGFVMDALHQYIDSLIYIPDSKQIFINTSNGKPITKHCLSKRFKAVMLGNNMDPIRFHDLRHLQATLLMYSGVNVQSISQRLGHSNTDTTLKVYTHNLNEKDKEVANVLDTTISNIKRVD
ncbi:tyrosine-type recombinase/integrase [Niameybacter massiliensis]|uniref:tyrosine-type recombinase/integrase n=1 Tax=Niameybacter massiliensis TaxID=1658108 RepID=UPI0006B4F6F7|nr:site-specific integrase [Niameybacter massiliensis]